MLTIRRSKADGFEEIGRDVAADLLRRGDSYLWLHFDKPKEEEIRFLQETLKIHDLTVEDIVHQNQRPKLDSCDNYVYLAVHPLRKRSVEDRTLRTGPTPWKKLDRFRSL